MKIEIAAVAVVMILTVGGLALAQMDDKGKEMMVNKETTTNDQAGMMDKGMMGKGMMGKGGMMKMMKMGMMQQMHATMAATPDGGVIVLSGGKLIKYDAQLNVVKEVDLPKPEMGMMDKGMKGGMKDDDDEDEAKEHAAHH